MRKEKLYRRKTKGEDEPQERDKKLEADRGKGELRLQKKEEVTMKQKEEKKANDLWKHR